MPFHDWFLQYAFSFDIMYRSWSNVHQLWLKFSIWHSVEISKLSCFPVISLYVILMVFSILIQCYFVKIYFIWIKVWNSFYKVVFCVFLCQSFDFFRQHCDRTGREAERGRQAFDWLASRLACFHSACRAPSGNNQLSWGKLQHFRLIFKRYAGNVYRQHALSLDLLLHIIEQDSKVIK